MSADPIRYYHRYKKTIETEEIYGENWLRFIYGNPLGSVFLWLAAKRAFFSKIYGWQMNKRVSANRVLPFIVKYNLNVEEFTKSPFDFKNFNEFFYRSLKKEARPIAEGENVAVFPADGRHLVFPNVDAAAGFYVKGAKFSLAELLGDKELAASYAEGGMVISRLCPVDYHRFHFPVSGSTTETRLIPGPLFSVSPIALRKRIDYLVQNKRTTTTVDSPTFGPVICMEVGATNVGAIVQTFISGRVQAKGAEKGLFKFGGSCVITLFKRNSIVFDEDLVAQSEQAIETYARMGDRLGVAIS
jgi:phosphatidylserine decarboxylase